MSFIFFADFAGVCIYNHAETSWDTFAFLGVFQITQAQPLPSSNKKCWTLVSRIFSGFQRCLGLGEKELQDNCKKDGLFYKGAQNDRKKLYEYCITVPRTFVHNCSFEPEIRTCSLEKLALYASLKFLP